MTTAIRAEARVRVRVRVRIRVGVRVRVSFRGIGLVKRVFKLRAPHEKCDQLLSY